MRNSKEEENAAQYVDMTIKKTAQKATFVIPQLQLPSETVQYQIGNEQELSERLLDLQNAKARCEMGPNKIVGHAQTILQETVQTETATLLGKGQESAVIQQQKKNQSEFLVMKLNEMKKKHKHLTDQLSQVSSYETSAQTVKKNINVNRQEAIQIAGHGQAVNFQAQELNGGQGSRTDVISMLLEGLNNITLQSGKKDIEVYVQKSELGQIVKDQLQKLNTLMAHYSEIKSERDVLLVQIQCLQKDNSALQDENLSMKEELKGTKGLLGDTRVELERMKTHFDILERKYIELLKKKQEVKIINKETFKETIIEKPIEILKYIVSQKIVKQPKEVRKIVRAKGHQKLTILEKLHIVNRDIHTPTIQTIEKVVEIPKRELVEVEKLIERPIVIEKPVYIEKTVPVPQVINRYIDRPIRQEIEVPIIHHVRQQDPLLQRERQHLEFVNSNLMRDNNALYDENQFLRSQHTNFSAAISNSPLLLSPPPPTQVVYQRA